LGAFEKPTINSNLNEEFWNISSMMIRIGRNFML
jgi:hypothetical protein